jgi:hypothetical protein
LLVEVLHTLLAPHELQLQIMPNISSKISE